MNLDQVFRSIDKLETNMFDQLRQIREQVQQMASLPIEVAKLTETSEHHEASVERITDTLDDTTKHFRGEIAAVREKAEKTSDSSVEKFAELQHSIASAADRIEQKFGSKIEEIRKELNALVSDYDKRIAALKAVAAAISVAFMLLQSAVGIAVSSYVNGWKVRIEENESQLKEAKKNVADLEVKVVQVKKAADESVRRLDESELPRKR